MFNFGLIVEELELFPEIFDFIDMENLLRIYGKILINSFAVKVPDSGRIIGRALYIGYE